MFVGDVGRHNAIDTIAGWMWLHGVDGADKIFHDRAADQRDGHQVGADGRAHRRLAAASRRWAELARQLGLALFGRATNRHFLCYTGFQALRGGAAGTSPARGEE